MLLDTLMHFYLKRIRMWFIFICHMFAFISGGYQPWDKFFIYHCDDVTMDKNAILRKFAYKWLQKSYVKIEMMLKHVIKKISHGLGLDMIFI